MTDTAIGNKLFATARHKHVDTADHDLEIWDVELAVGGEVVGARGGHHHLVPGLLTRLLPRRRDQPEFSHGCYQRGTVQ